MNRAIEFHYNISKVILEKKKKKHVYMAYFPLDFSLKRLTVNTGFTCNMFSVKWWEKKNDNK